MRTILDVVAGLVLLVPVVGMTVAFIAAFGWKVAALIAVASVVIGWAILRVSTIGMRRHAGRAGGGR
jgi:zinc transporter ZupT